MVQDVLGWRRLWPVVRARFQRVTGRLRRFGRSASEVSLPASPSTVFEAVAHFSARGPGFEEKPTRALSSVEAGVRLIAFYLPQYHPTPENDKFWGTGFTEWRNVARGLPRYRGHYQPRIPRDLGHVDLNNPASLHAQASLARSAGIEAFCFYYYWFDGKRLLERPLDRFLEEQVDQDFCLMWANENWTRRWDGRDQDVLMQQTYSPTDDAGFIEDTSRYMAHPRYLRVADRPLFIIYCAHHIPEAERRIAQWRQAWTARLGVEPLLLMAQTYQTRDPRPFGLDGAVEFPPHKVSQGIRNRRDSQHLLDPNFSGQVRAYTDIVEKAQSEARPSWPLVRTVSPHWDNEARRPGRGVAFQGSLPARFERWLSSTAERAIREPLEGEALVFVNAWNEWAEGAYLEPDVHYGHACLNAVRRAIGDPAETPRGRGLLLVGHDAHANGAQMLLLELARHLSARADIDVTVLLLGGGSLLPDYQETCPVFVVDKRSDIEPFLEHMAFSMILCNTVVVGDIVDPLRRCGARIVSLVHEMPEFIKERKLQEATRLLIDNSDEVVVASPLVHRGLVDVCGEFDTSVRYQPQGVYSLPRCDAEVGTTMRARHAIADDSQVILVVAYADARKGFDRFLDVALAYHQREKGVVGNRTFVWVGARSAQAEHCLAQARERHGSLPDLRLIDFSDDVGAWLSVADVYYLCSREDPYPTAALEAFYAGLPVVAHKDCTGMEDVVAEHGLVLARDASSDDVLQGFDRVLSEAAADATERRRAHVIRHHDFARYVDVLVGLLDSARSRPLASSDTRADDAS